jgi:hypothetical protein
MHCGQLVSKQLTEVVSYKTGLHQKVFHVQTPSILHVELVQWQLGDLLVNFKTRGYLSNCAQRYV